MRITDMITQDEFAWEFKFWSYGVKGWETTSTLYCYKVKKSLVILTHKIPSSNDFYYFVLQWNSQNHKHYN